MTYTAVNKLSVHLLYEHIIKHKYLKFKRIGYEYLCSTSNSLPVYVYNTFENPITKESTTHPARTIISQLF